MALMKSTLLRGCLVCGTSSACVVPPRVERVDFQMPPLPERSGSVGALATGVRPLRGMRSFRAQGLMSILRTLLPFILVLVSANAGASTPEVRVTYSEGLGSEGATGHGDEIKAEWQA